MNRVVVSVPRVLDSAMVVTQDTQLQIPTGTIPPTAVSPLVVSRIQAVATETQMTNITITPLEDNQHYSRITAAVTIPLTVTITDSNNAQFETHTSITKNIGVILFIPEDTAFPYSITAEGAFACDGCTITADTLTIIDATTKILIRVTANTDLLIPCYGYAPLNPEINNQFSNTQSFLNQPLFPRGKIY